VVVDDVYPYRLYSGQQDNSAVIIKSRSDGPSIGARDWGDGAGCESANIGVDRRNPRYVYGGCYQGIFEELDQETERTRSIMAWPELALTEPTDQIRYRFNWTAPAVVSQHDSSVLYLGANVLFRTRDRGRTWAPISPDLTRDDRATQGAGGTPITNEGAGGEVYGTIVTVAESPHDARTVYVGTDDGLVQRTRDGGRTWTNVTPAGVGVGLANEIEVSPHDPATVYLAFRMDRQGDPAPYAFRSTDHGASWTRITAGLRTGEPVRVVREDPERRGLLYAGTETGAYVSFDAGARWQPLSRNLPVVPVTDLEVRHGDLYAATEGRAFWALDDLSPLAQRTDEVARADVHLYAPRAALLAGGPSAPTTTAGRNPPAGRERLRLPRPRPRLVADGEARVPRRGGEGAAQLRARPGRRRRRRPAGRRPQRGAPHGGPQGRGSTRCSGTCARSRPRRCPGTSTSGAGVGRLPRRAGPLPGAPHGGPHGADAPPRGAAGPARLRAGRRGGGARLARARDQRPHHRDPRRAARAARREGAGGALRGARQGGAERGGDRGEGEGDHERRGLDRAAALDQGLQRAGRDQLPQRHQRAVRLPHGQPRAERRAHAALARAVRGARAGLGGAPRAGGRRRAAGGARVQQAAAGRAGGRRDHEAAPRAHRVRRGRGR
jgi:hypothetical protein